jgi:hypothetical protein
MHAFWDQAIADLSLEQVNHHERPGVLPITFSLFHYVNGEDRSVGERLLAEPAIWSDGWAARTGIDGGPIRRGTPLAVAEQVRLTDLDAWRAYQRAVFARTEAALAALPDERWDEVVFPAVPDSFKGGFLDYLIGDGQVRLGDLMDVLLYQHGMRHLGEIEHARSLVGLQGVG